MNMCNLQKDLWDKFFTKLDMNLLDRTSYMGGNSFDPQLKNGSAPQKSN